MLTENVNYKEKGNDSTLCFCTKPIFDQNEM